MRRTLLLSAIGAGFILLFASQGAWAAKQDKVDVCHKPGVVEEVSEACDLGNGEEGCATVTTSEGRIISVSGNAVPAHLAHGDAVEFDTSDDDARACFVTTTSECGECPDEDD
jgi:hypothetical protein